MVGPSATAETQPAANHPLQHEQIESALNYVENHGALRSWTGEKWAVDVTSLPPEHQSVFERPELADYVQEALEDMNYRLQRNFASGAYRGGSGPNPDSPV